MANWKRGGTGKGSDGSRINHEKYSEGMDLIKKDEWITCSTCKNYKGGFDVLGNTLCKKVERFNLNDGKKCEEWEK